MQIKGVIFDLDGTLLDSTYVWDSAGANYLRRMGQVPEENLSDRILGKSLMQAATYLKNHYDLGKTEQEIMDGINDVVEEAYLTEIQEKKGVREVLDELTRRHIPMCVATLTDRYLVEAVFKRLDILHYFKDIITATEVGSGKDQPIIYQKAAECIGTEIEETLVAEDMLYTIQTAKKGGFPVLAVYDKAADRMWNEIEEIADYIVMDWETFGYEMF